MICPAGPQLFVGLSIPSVRAQLERAVRGLGAERKSVQDVRETPPPNLDTCESEPEHNREVLIHTA